MGIDIGSTSSDAVILKDGREIIAQKVIPLGAGTIGPQLAYEGVLKDAGITEHEITGAMATGYGRKKCDYATKDLSELTCHAKGIHFLTPSARTVIDIGGQDAKVLEIGANGQLVNFAMNDKCAAGTGRFLEVMAKVLNVKIEDMGALSLEAKEPVTISNTCTVFAESEVISQLSSKKNIADIVAGIHRSVAKRVAGMAMRVGKHADVAMSGGVALNTGIVKALEEELSTSIVVHPYCQLAGAIGAAVAAWEDR